MVVHQTLNLLYPFVGGRVGSNPTGAAMRYVKCLNDNDYEFWKSN